MSIVVIVPEGICFDVNPCKDSYHLHSFCLMSDPTKKKDISSIIYEEITLIYCCCLRVLFLFHGISLNYLTSRLSDHWRRNQMYSGQCKDVHHPDVINFVDILKKICCLEK